MPKEYVKMRNALAKKGVPYDEAQSQAAASYNKKHPDAPVTGEYEKKHSGRKLQRGRQMRKKAKK
jgi:hypothetical protein